MYLYLGILMRMLFLGRFYLSFMNRLHRFQAIEYDGKFFVNPGTATGAWTGLFNGYSFIHPKLPTQPH